MSSTHDRHMTRPSTTPPRAIETLPIPAEAASDTAVPRLPTTVVSSWKGGVWKTWESFVLRIRDDPDSEQNAGFQGADSDRAEGWVSLAIPKNTRRGSPHARSDDSRAAARKARESSATARVAHRWFGQGRSHRGEESDGR